MTETALERDLVTLLAVHPSPAVLELIDKRLERLLERASPRPSGRRRWRVSPLLGFAAAALLAATAVAGYGLLERVAREGAAVPWALGTKIDQSRTIEGRTVTIERGYADANQTVLAVSGMSTSNKIFALDGVLTDHTGAVVPRTSGYGSDRLGENASLLFYGPNAGAPLTVTFASVDGVLGPWVFTFDLPNAGGIHVHMTPATVAGILVTPDDVLISPSMVVANLSVRSPEVADSSLGGWAAIGVVSHDGWVQSTDTGGGTTVVDGTLRLTTQIHLSLDHTGSTAGPWVFTINELVGVRADGSQVRLTGPWVLLGADEG